MPKQPKEYQRLPGRGLRRKGAITLTRTSSRLWVGADHLLCIDSTGYAEDYRRFYFNDIQAITLRSTARGRNWDMALGLLALGFALAGVPAGVVGRGIFWSVAGLFFLCFLINWLRGPTCECNLQTAVQREQLPSLDRLRVARKALPRLRSLVEQAQGGLTGDEVVARLRAAALEGMTSGMAAPLPGRQPMREAVPEPSSYSGWSHMAMFYLLLATGLIGVLDFFVRHVALVVVATAVALGASVAAIIAVARQHRSRLSAGLRRLTWWVIGFMVINTVAGYVFYIALVIGRGDATVDQWEYMNMLAQMSPLDSPVQLALSLFVVAGSFGLSVPGLVWMHQFARGQRASKAEPI